MLDRPYPSSTRIPCQPGNLRSPKLPVFHSCILTFMVFSEICPTTFGVVFTWGNIIFLSCCWTARKALQRHLNVHRDLLWEVYHSQSVLRTQLSRQETQSSKPGKCLIFQKKVTSDFSTTPSSNCGMKQHRGKEKMFFVCSMPLLASSLILKADFDPVLPL